MKKLKQFVSMMLVASLFVVGCNKDEDDYNSNPQPSIQSSVLKAGGDSATIAAKLTEFRALLGDPLNSTPGQTAGRREVNWDGVPAALSNNSNFPLDFFNNTDPAGPNGRKRGLQYASNGTLIRADTSDFSEIDGSYANQFEPFSRRRMIIAVGTNVSDIIFKVPGTNTDAFVKGFGVVFSDVDDANSTYLEFFNGAKSLGVFKAPAAAGSAKYSFLGVQFPNEKITRVRITAGNAALANGVKDLTDNGVKDLVAIDDFLYNEPLVSQ